ncbi:hypothetical protein [Shewanella scandinavica]|uniref:hypothetical protein n=1 Tax=Shewanella scandinavica TaxID=3063538 RepID=UPI00318B9800
MPRKINQILLHNPHSFDMLLFPLSYKLAGKKPHLKYCHIPDMLKDCSNKINCIVDYSESSLITSSKFISLPFFIRFIIVTIELFFWKKINHQYCINVFNEQNMPKGATVLTFSYKGCQFVTEEKLNVFNKSERLLCHLSHYMINTSEKASLLKSYQDKVFLLADCDFSSNSYFIKYFSWYKRPLITIPFIVKNRFVNRHNYRRNKILLSGTVHNLFEEKPEYLYTDFISHFNCSSYHLLRSSSVIQNLKYIDNKTVPFRDASGSGSQKDYFKVDLVDLLNGYQYVCYDSELSGALALSSMEAIACGTVPFLSSSSIKGLELHGKFNFVEFNGSIDDFVQKADFVINSGYISSIKCKCDIQQHLYELTLNNFNLVVDYEF